MIQDEKYQKRLYFVRTLANRIIEMSASLDYSPIDFTIPYDMEEWFISFFDHDTCEMFLDKKCPVRVIAQKNIGRINGKSYVLNTDAFCFDFKKGGCKEHVRVPWSVLAKRLPKNLQIPLDRVRKSKCSALDLLKEEE